MLRAKLLHDLIDPFERNVVDVLRDVFLALGLVLGRTAHDVERVPVDVEDPKGDDLVLVLDVPRVVDDRTLRQPLGRFVAVSPPCLAELVPLIALQTPGAEKNQLAFSSPRVIVRKEPMPRGKPA